MGRGLQLTNSRGKVLLSSRKLFSLIVRDAEVRERAGQMTHYTQCGALFEAILNPPPMEWDPIFGNGIDHAMKHRHCDLWALRTAHRLPQFAASQRPCAKAAAYSAAILIAK